ncbi:MAG: chemotaxis protein CheA, partial [Bryocella sp.]
MLTQLADRQRGILQLLETRGHEGRRDRDDDGLLLRMLESAANGKGIHVVEESQRIIAEGSRATEKFSHQVESVVRVEVETLNRLMNLVGELVQTRNQFQQASVSEETFMRLGRRLDGVTTNLRESVMQARMQPVGQLFQRFPRLVREVAASCGKRVRMESHGGETGLDKSLLEALKDPITHAIRNAIDHGIELPQVRFPQGKSPDGCVQLRAYHDVGQIVVEVRDDGAGIDREKVIERALERELISPDRAATLRDDEVMELLFAAGFSTSDEVTTISGRGVGLDVVRANVERIGGSVELHSVRGVGSVLRMRVPLTLAILPALVAQCGGQKFALSHCSLEEMMIVHRVDEEKYIRWIGNSRMVLLHDRLVPLLDLGEMLEIPTDRERGYYIAVLQAKGRRFGLVVDDLGEPQEIVVKPLSRALDEVGIYSGATILGDGKIALILDTAGIARRARLNGAAEIMVPAVEHAPAKSAVESAEASETVLVFADEANERTAVPLRFVERIEPLDPQRVEHVGGREAIQHRGSIVMLEQTGGRKSSFAEAESLVLICTRPESHTKVGILVREVLEVAEGTSLAAGSGKEKEFVCAN